MEVTSSNILLIGVDDRLFFACAISRLKRMKTRFDAKRTSIRDSHAFFDRIRIGPMTSRAHWVKCKLHWFTTPEAARLYQAEMRISKTVNVHPADLKRYWKENAQNDVYSIDAVIGEVALMRTTIDGHAKLRANNEQLRHWEQTQLETMTAEDLESIGYAQGFGEKAHNEPEVSMQLSIQMVESRADSKSESRSAFMDSVPQMQNPPGYADMSSVLSTPPLSYLNAISQQISSENQAVTAEPSEEFRKAFRASLLDGKKSTSGEHVLFLPGAKDGAQTESETYLSDATVDAPEVRSSTNTVGAPETSVAEPLKMPPAQNEQQSFNPQEIENFTAPEFSKPSKPGTFTGGEQRLFVNSADLDDATVANAYKVVQSITSAMKLPEQFGECPVPANDWDKASAFEIQAVVETDQPSNVSPARPASFEPETSSQSAIVDQMEPLLETARLWASNPQSDSGNFVQPASVVPTTEPTSVQKQPSMPIAPPLAPGRVSNQPDTYVSAAGKISVAKPSHSPESTRKSEKAKTTVDVPKNEESVSDYNSLRSMRAVKDLTATSKPEEYESAEKALREELKRGNDTAADLLKWTEAGKHVARISHGARGNNSAAVKKALKALKDDAESNPYAKSALASLMASGTSI